MYRTYPTGPSQFRNRKAASGCVLMAAVMSFLSTSAAHGDQVPEGLPASDWSSIRAAYEANRHAAVAVEGGFVARNPGQQWRTRFDGRGFLTTPDAGVRPGGTSTWSWGMELTSYGRADDPSRDRDGAGQLRCVVALDRPVCVEANGVRVEYEWDENLTEWYVNDARGLEHGYTVHQRSEGTSALLFTLAVRGDLRPHVSAEGRDVTFVDDGGAAVVNYRGLTVTDADGTGLRAWFEPADEGLVLSVDDRGARYPLTIDPIAQQAYLKASNTGASDKFGYSVAVSGDTVVVGAFGEASSATGVNGNHADNSAESAGAAYVFVRNSGGPETWTQQAYLKASNTGTGDFFGWSVAVSGDTVVVGAPNEDSNATGINGNQADNSALSSGAAYVFVRDGASWSQQAYLKASNTGVDDSFGYSVAASGDTVVVGAINEDSSATGVGGNQADNSAANSGAAYVFFRPIGIFWNQQAYLKASNTGAGDLFGCSVARSGDTVMVGAYYEDSNAMGVNGNQTDNSAFDSGAAYVFVRLGTSWSQQAYLKASNTEASDWFGWSVAVSADTVVVGAYGEDSGDTGIDGNQANNFGILSGAAYVFVRDGGFWSQQAYLKASNTGVVDQFGYSVAVSGDTVVIGADLEDSSATGVNANQCAPCDNSASASGAAYVFIRSGGIWSQQAYLKASNTEASDGFGTSVAVSGDTVVIGADGEDSSATGVNFNQADNSASSSGAVYVFTGAGPPPDTDGDGVPDASDICPDNGPGLPVDCTGRPLRDCDNDCLVDGADVQCIVDELLGQ